MNKDELAKEISDLVSNLYDASIQSSMGGLGGCKHYEKESFPVKFQPYIQKYINQERESSQCVIDYLFDNGHLHYDVHNS